MTKQSSKRALNASQSNILKWFAVGMAVSAGAHAEAATTEVVLHNFAAAVGGANSQAPLTIDKAGNLYGTTASGGVANAGVVFKLDASGEETILHSFTGGNDGGGPLSGVLAYDGVLYGTTPFGGTANSGVVFALDSTGHETVLYNFTGPDGLGPEGSLIRDPQGNLYGTTVSGGTANMGVLFKLTAAGQEIVLHNFTGPDGAIPLAGVTLDAVGNLYGTTQGGGIGGGVVYKFDTTGVLTVLHIFMSGADGFFASGGLIRDAAGNLYGNTIGGGLSNAGVVFKIDANAHETVIYNFTGMGDGGGPYGSLMADRGNLYGVTGNGGAGADGTVFRINAKGHESVLYSFRGGADGARPQATVIHDAAGNLYGTTENGGPANTGIVYKLDSTGTETILYIFTGGSDGTSPESGVVRDAAGNLYGTAEEGGPASAGVVYRLDPAGQQDILYSFAGTPDGAYPEAGVIRDSGGNLYGTTLNGGTAGMGVVYRVDTNGHETLLHNFTGGSDGMNPQSGVIQDAAGNLYGTATFGGLFNMGIVYKLSLAGEETILHSFAGGFDGSNPSGFILFDSQNNLYGTTSNGGSHNGGTLYKINPAGNETILYAFSGGSDGRVPVGGITQDGAGNLYGTCVDGGAAGSGTVYAVSPGGQETVLYSFTGGADGAYPYSEVIRDGAGNLFGTASFGGAANYGVVYEVSTSGQQTVLHSFTGGADGSYPYAGVIRDTAGNLFGTTPSGGKRRVGLVFKLKP